MLRFLVYLILILTIVSISPVNGTYDKNQPAGIQIKIVKEMLTKLLQDMLENVNEQSYEVNLPKVWQQEIKLGPFTNLMKIEDIEYEPV